MTQLCEYYKYHIDIPRLFHNDKVFFFLEAKRQLIYKEIKRRLGIKDSDSNENES